MRLDREAHALSPWLSLSPLRRAAQDSGIPVRTQTQRAEPRAHAVGEELDLHSLSVLESDSAAKRL